MRVALPDSTSASLRALRCLGGHPRLYHASSSVSTVPVRTARAARWEL